MRGLALLRDRDSRKHVLRTSTLPEFAFHCQSSQQLLTPIKIHQATITEVLHPTVARQLILCCVDDQVAAGTPTQRATCEVNIFQHNIRFRREVSTARVAFPTARLHWLLSLKGCATSCDSATMTENKCCASMECGWCVAQTLLLTRVPTSTLAFQRSANSHSETRKCQINTFKHNYCSYLRSTCAGSPRFLSQHSPRSLAQAHAMTPLDLSTNSRLLWTECNVRTHQLASCCNPEKKKLCKL